MSHQLLPAAAGRTRRRWTAPLVIALCSVLVAVALYAADRLEQPEVDGTSAFLPADGASWGGERVTRLGNATSTTSTVSESAVVLGRAVAGAVDWRLGALLLQDQDGSLDASRFWRTTTTSLTAPLGRSQDVRVYRTGPDLILLGESGRGPAYSYEPGLVELPADAAPGVAWESQGSAGDGISYLARFGAAQGADGCLEVTGTIAYTSGDSRTERFVSRTWCPGQGITVATERSGGATVTDHRAAVLPAATPVTTDRIGSWTPERWRPQQLTNTAVDPVAGRKPMVGSPSSVTPVMSSSGVLVRGTASSQDLNGFTPGSDTDWPLRWRAHPGGVVLTLTAFGDVLVATTSQRRVVGYTADGVRRWDVALDEVVMTRPTRVSDGELALASLGGEVVVVDLATGRERWRTRPGSDIGAAPVVSGQFVVVVDLAGRLIALQASSGRELWRQEISSSRFLVAHGSQVVVVQAGDLVGFDAGRGDPLWRVPYDGYEHGLSAFGDWVVLAHGDQGTAVDSSGRVAWNRPGLHAVTARGSHLVCWGRRDAEVLDRAGVSVTRFATAEDTAGHTQQFVAGPDGVYQLESSWTFRSWTDG